MIRKIFGGAMVMSLTGAVILGGVFAWGASGSGDGSNTVGESDTETFYEGNDSVLGPNDGVYRLVGHVEMYNTGPDFGIQLTSGNVLITDAEEELDDDGLCRVEHFQGMVSALSPGIKPPGQTPGGNYDDVDDDPAQGLVYIKVLPEAPEACMGNEISYTVTLNANIVAMP
ncbi:MAG: hypothetical protein C0506_00865 [Anaerolinea sp.]|nr:hypothetical protein [Anaerolinea sp.]